MLTPSHPSSSWVHSSSSSLLCPAPSLLLLRISDLVSIGGQFSETKRPATLKSLPRARQTFFFSQIFTSMAPSIHALYNGIFESSVYLSADCSFSSPSTASSCSTSLLVSFGPMSGMQYPNDADFSFCQRCGYKGSTNTLTPVYTKLKIDLSSVDKRLASIRAQRKSLPYERQKSALKKKLETFLGSLPSPKTLQSATPHDLTRFLVWKDRKGKTKVHVPQCPLFWSHSKTLCKCPTRLAAGTVDNIIGKLRAIFTSTGRNGPWNDLFGSGNPACDKSVKEYLHFKTKEQAAAHVSSKQALPLFFDKLSKLIRHLISEAFSPSKVPTVQRYIFARDAAFFCVDFFSVIEVQI